MKPFEPTPSRLERARREGDHPLSRDVVAVAAFCGAFLGVTAIAPSLESALPADLRAVLAGAPSPRLWLMLIFAVALACGCGSGAAVLATLAQTRGLVLRPLAYRLAPRRMLDLDATGDVVRAAIAVAAGVCGIACTARPSPDAIQRSLGIALGAGIASALLDLLGTRRLWRRRLRMTHDEMRRDLREHEGDPQTRARRRRLHRIVLRGGLRQVRRASFVVVNPTHLAVALRYAPPETPVPAIIVRAADAGAQRMKALAAELGIPSIEDPGLARALYAHEALGPIPPALYLAVAQIIAALQRSSTPLGTGPSA